MSQSPLGHTLIVANPAAHSGKGARGIEFARSFLKSYASATDGFEVIATQAAGDATQIAAKSAEFDTVLALGGDGVIHEVVQGLMQIGEKDRPQLGIIPMGSGNDYARTLGMVKNDPEAALAQLVRGTTKSVELGHVASDTGDSAYFMETLSFGLDAAIAIDTTARRANNAHQEGEALFITSGLKLLATAGAGYPCTVSFDGEDPQQLDTLIFAVQVGPSYGGGFLICPDADPTDGLLSVCYNVKRPALPHTLALFGMARTGAHARSKTMRLRTFSRAHVEYASAPPCQVDGEEFLGRIFDIEVCPASLSVIFAR